MTRFWRLLLTRKTATLRADRRGVALVEFALTVPFLILLYCGGFQLMDAIAVQRKVTTAVRALADLTTQNTTLSIAQADQILAASAQIMTPYSIVPAVVRITQVQIQPNGTAVVSWSRALNGTGYAQGSTVAVNSLVAQANTYLIYSEIGYTYTPVLGGKYLGPIAFSDRLFMTPRNSASVTLTAS